MEQLYSYGQNWDPGTEVAGYRSQGGFQASRRSLFQGLDCRSNPFISHIWGHLLLTRSTLINSAGQNSESIESCSYYIKLTRADIISSIVLLEKQLLMISNLLASTTEWSQWNMNQGIFQSFNWKHSYLFKELFSFSDGCSANWSIIPQTTKVLEVSTFLSDSSSNGSLWGTKGIY